MQKQFWLRKLGKASYIIDRTETRPPFLGYWEL